MFNERQIFMPARIVAPSGWGHILHLLMRLAFCHRRKPMKIWPPSPIMSMEIEKSSNGGY